jgi:hypothetical protein
LPQGGGQIWKRPSLIVDAHSFAFLATSRSL